ncbi:hypothetical protein ACRTDU_17515 [Sunxiuqinia elliptica]
MKRRKKAEVKKGTDTGKGKEKRAGTGKGEGPRGKIETETDKSLRIGLLFNERFELPSPNQTFSSFTSFSI